MPQRPAPPGDSAPDAPLGPKPEIAGRAAIRDAVRRKLFATIAGQESTPPSDTPRDPSSDPSCRGPSSGGSAQSDLADSTGDDGRDPDPDHIEQFRVLRRIGKGAMGVVFECHDPELNRRVAIKMLQPQARDPSPRDSSYTERLVREAQALAQLSHPNVITIHQVSTSRERLFLVMEYIEGEDLAQWLNTPRPWPEIVGKFLLAGRGLCAAHRANIVHRDFKPQNVVLGTDGQVRVVDFGLARTNAVASHARLHVDGCDVTEEPTSVLTQAGALLGTPAYMAPEQLLGEIVSPAADQFSFCVALYEALYGQRPFPGERLGELLQNVLEGNILPIPPGSRTPTRFVSILRRGLRRDPAERYPTMEPLLAALEHGLRSSWRRLSIGTAAIVLAGGSLLWAAGRHAPQYDCEKQASEIETIWNADTNTRLEDVFSTTEVPYAEASARTVAHLFDRYATDWSNAARQTCAAGLVAGTPDELDSAAWRCLDQRRAELEEVLRLLMEPNPGTVLHAVETATMLADVAGCRERARLEPWKAAQPRQVREQMQDLHARIIEVRARGRLGQNELAIGLARKVIAEAEALDAHAAVGAAWLAVAEVHIEERSFGRAEPALRQAIDWAERTGDHATHVAALTQLMYVLGRSGRRFEEIRQRFTEATTMLKLIDAPPLMQARVDAAFGWESAVEAKEIDDPARAADELERALSQLQRALPVYKETFGLKHPQTAELLSNIGRTLKDMKRYVEAESHLRQSIAAFEATFGPTHPDVGRSLNSLGVLLQEADRLDEAIAVQRRALANKAANFGDSDPSALRSRFNLALALKDTGDLGEAAALLEVGLALRPQEGDDNERPPVWDWEIGLGTIYLEQGRSQEAIAKLETAKQRLFEAMEQDPTNLPRTAAIKHTLAEVSLELARASPSNVQRAREEVRRALELAGQIGDETLAKRCRDHLAQLRRRSQPERVDADR